MPHCRDQFLHDANVKRFQRQLMGATSVQQRKVLMILLAEEAALAKRRGWFPTTK